MMLWDFIENYRDSTDFIEFMVIFGDVTDFLDDYLAGLIGCDMHFIWISWKVMVI